jgi:hypothetical protein
MQQRLILIISLSPDPNMADLPGDSGLQKCASFLASYFRQASFTKKLVDVVMLI